ncbi:hypothetical protein NLJ89_g2001 [Agrocybe chaxingu]|uniref:Cytochrome c oxidase subunit 8, mitochondrial n=1 Tax=Agrocybe chaxingu TaxID=84603 RepID=A0A9W8MYZ0_9AGAR|nr:hypothetical protein NLJ89_g2001 [Agrocybe chaxingu]
MSSSATLIMRAARLPVSRQIVRQPVLRRQLHDAHDPMPFSMKNRRALGLKMFAYMGTGFSIPFIATYVTLAKFKAST